MVLNPFFNFSSKPTYLVGEFVPVVEQHEDAHLVRGDLYYVFAR